MPPKKKVKSAKKKKPLTEEEKAVAAEQALLAAKEEKQKRKAIATKFLKEKLLQEEKNSKLSLMKINSQWRHIMRNAKIDELRAEIDVLSQVFERVLDRKESIIQAYLRDLAEAEQQEQISSRAHISNIDRLVDFQQEVVDKLQGAFKGELEAVREEFMKERELILKHHESEMSDIKDIIYALEMLYEDRSKENDADFTSRRDEMRTKNLDSRTTLKAALESTHKDVWDTFDQAMKQYQSSTAEKRQEFERLRERDRKAAVQIEANTLKIQKLQDKINAYKHRISTNAKGTHGSNIELKRDKESVSKQVHQLKLHVQRTRERNKRALVQTVMKGKECKEKLGKKLDKAKRVLALSEVCGKYETEEEKVLPFYKSSVSNNELTEEALKEVDHAEEQLAQTGRLDQDPTMTRAEAAALAPKEALPGPTETHSVAYDLDNRQVNTYDCLDNFWKRYNKVLLEKLAIEREVDGLESENEELKHILQEYLEGISVNETVLNKNNTLLVVNSRTNAPMNVPVGDSRVQMARPTVIEATAEPSIRLTRN